MTTIVSGCYNRIFLILTFSEDQYGRSRHSQGRTFSPDRRTSRSEVQDPLNRDTLVPFRQYSDWLRQAHPDEWRDDSNGEPSEEPEGTSADRKELSTVRLRYEEYRRSFIRKQVDIPLTTRNRVADSQC
jgi:hypothetical protein